ncbi:MAG: hypothetical protein U1F50_03325 [Rubrivivax sp.]
MDARGRGRRALRSACLAAGLALGAAAQAQAQTHEHHDHGSGGVLLFLSAEAHRYSGAPQERLNEDAPVSADLVLSLGAGGPLRLFGEFLASSEEHDVERLQLGWEARPDTVVWLGRYHQPASAWNLEHHHGRYLQTSVTRPGVELWEDERGIVPQHLSGLLVESRHELPGGQALRLAGGTGLGTTLRDEGLEPLDLMKPRREGRHWSWSGRVSWLPDQLGASQFGLLAARHRSPVADAALATQLDATEVQHDLLGAFADWHPGEWRLLGAVYGIAIGTRGGSGERTDRMTVGYLQLEGQLPAALTAYGRHEASDGVRGSAVVAAVSPQFDLRRSLLGLRWDGWHRQALTLEIARGNTVDGSRWETRLQWSAAFP